MQTGIFEGRSEIKYSYGRWGWTRSNGKKWHGGVDVVGLDSSYIRMPYYYDSDGIPHKITGTVTRARIVTDKSNATWEWGYYVCVMLAQNQTPDSVNYLYFCHCEKLLVKVGQRVSSGDVLAVMGNTGNASGGYKHCHLEVRQRSTSKGLDPTHYIGHTNEVGVWGSVDTPQVNNKSQIITIGPVTRGDADQFYMLASKLDLLDRGLYKQEYVD